ncbi:MAG: hypothetical protein GWN58_51260 [Anaerolineae bacterium]|nr:hypothetical protein [Anaerolineae bacterium]
MRNNPEGLAWVVLLSSFFACIGLAIAAPLGIRYYVLHARVAQSVMLEVQRGPLRVTLAGRGEQFAIDGERGDIPERTVVATDGTAGRLVVHTPQPDRPVIATVQLYESTEAVLVRARSPRFAASRLPHEVALEVRGGRVRVSASNDDSRPTVVEVQTPRGLATLRGGRFTIEVNEETTHITVQEGLAEFTDQAGLTIQLDPDQRARATSNGVTGPLPAARDLIVNGDFADPLDTGWTSYSRDIQIEGESGGEVQRTEIEGGPVVVITRRGTGHAETGLSQRIGTDIRDFSFLQLHLLLRVEEHNVPVCGSLGSECPVMVRIAYEDADGTDQEWLQGFYSLPDTSTPGNPSFCVTCSVRNEHVQVPEDTWYSHDSPNLIPLMSQDDRAPILIKSITVYASGHTYQSTIAEVELIGQE